MTWPRFARLECDPRDDDDAENTFVCLR